MLFVLAVVLFIADLVFGSVQISFSRVVAVLIGNNDEASAISTIITDFRMPKAMAAVLTGIGLSVSGLQMQTIFRNPLAGPYVMGLSSGASLGVALMVMLSSSTAMAYTLFGNFAIAIAAWLGTGLVLLIIMAVSVRINDILTILILGLLFGSAVSAVVSILQYFSSESALKSFIIWTMGSLGGVSKSELYVMTFGVVLGLVPVILHMKKFNVLLHGEQFAESVGVSAKRMRVPVFISTGLLVGSITAFCGPIAFVGIAVPHIVKMVFKTTNHVILFPASALAGAVWMLFADIVSQLPGQATVLPINSITALIGIPVVIYIVVGNKKANF